MRPFSWIAGLALMAALGACVRPPPQAATLVARTLTSVPQPILTSTPSQYDLILQVQDASGAPIPGADVVIPESGSSDAKQTDASGIVTWNGLGGPEATLIVSAPGYYRARQPTPLELGENQRVVVLLNNPHALLPAEACAPNEKMLYREDFEDGQAQGWPEITAAVNGQAENGWGIRAQADGNQTASVTGIHESTDALQGFLFDNVVWRLKVLALGYDGYFVLDLKDAQASGTHTSYAVKWGAGPFLSLVHMQAPQTGESAGKESTLRMVPGRWYYFEVSAFGSTVQVWVDGKSAVEYADPRPLPAGSIGLEAHIFKDPNTAYFFDDLSVCELSAPFSTTLYKPPTP